MNLVFPIVHIIGSPSVNGQFGYADRFSLAANGTSTHSGPVKIMVENEPHLTARTERTEILCLIPYQDELHAKLRQTPTETFHELQSDITGSLEENASRWETR